MHKLAENQRVFKGRKRMQSIDLLITDQWLIISRLLVAF